MLSFGIYFRDTDDNEYYATVYKSKVPTTLYAVHFYDQITKDQYDVLIIGVGLGEFVVIDYPETLIPNISELVVEEIRKYLSEINEPIE